MIGRELKALRPGQRIDRVEPAQTAVRIAIPQPAVEREITVGRRRVLIQERPVDEQPAVRLERERGSRQLSQPSSNVAVTRNVPNPTRSRTVRSTSATR